LSFRKVASIVIIGIDKTAMDADKGASMKGRAGEMNFEEMVMGFIPQSAYRIEVPHDNEVIVIVIVIVTYTAYHNMT
jgi:hypothetical protein